ncbi:unnamed protein product [Chrysoparadoxa australica]
MATATFARHGAPSVVLSMQGDEDRAPGAGEVAVKMKAAGCSYADLDVITGLAGAKRPLPAVAGIEGYGEVMAVGSGVKGLAKGDTVVPTDPLWGTWRSQAVVNQGMLAKIPSGTAPEVSALLGSSICTAYRLLSDFAKLKSGDVVVQSNAASSVGQAVIQLAKAKGIQTVNLVESAEEKVLYLLACCWLQAGAVITPAPRTHFTRLLLFLSQVSNAALAIDGSGGNEGGMLGRCLVNGGKMVLYGASKRQGSTLPIGAMIFNEVSAEGFSLSTWASQHSQEEYASMVDEVRAYSTPAPVPFCLFCVCGCVASHVGSSVAVIGLRQRSLPSGHTMGWIVGM